MMVPAFILAVALCPDCEFKAVGIDLMTERECAAMQVEYSQAFPQREFDTNHKGEAEVTTTNYEV